MGKVRGGLGQNNLLHLFCLLLCSAALALSQSAISSEQRANRYLESVRKSPPLAMAFLRDMPKGGDLHNHLGGAINAEDLIDFAAQDKLCVENASLSLLPDSCDSSCDKGLAKRAVKCAYHDQDFYSA